MSSNRIRDLERRVIGTMIVNQAHIPHFMEKLREEHFTYDVHRRIFQGIKACVDDGQQVDMFTVLDRIKGDVEMPHSTIADITAGDDFSGMTLPRHWLSLLLKDVAHRVFVDGMREVIREKSGDLEATAEEVRRLTQVLETQTPETRVAVGAAEMIRDLEEHDQKDDRRIDVPFESLNALMNGLKPGELVVIAGRPSHGKTALSMAMGMQISRFFPVTMFSLEMSTMEIASRMRCAHGIKSGSSKEERDLAKQAMSKLKFHVIDKDCHTPQTIGAIARKMRAAGNCDLIIIDYLQLMDPDEKMDNKVHEVAAITKSLKRLARNLDIPVVLLSQLNRSVETRSMKSPVLSDLRDGGSIEQDADKVLFVSRPARFGEQVPDVMTNVDVAKNRNGRVGQVRMCFDGTTFAFHEIMESVA